MGVSTLANNLHVDDLQEALEEYCKENLLDEAHLGTILERLLQTHDPRDPVPIEERVIKMSDMPSEEALLVELADSEDVSPNAEQAEVIQQVQHGATGLFVLSGGPGTGKTFVTRYLIHQWRQMKVPMVLAATTGAAATRISKAAQTVHTAFQIPLEGMYLSSLTSLSDTYQRLKSAKVIIIDEMSMLSAPMLNLVLFRLQQCGGYPDVKALLADKLILLVGDHAQVGT